MIARILLAVAAPAADAESIAGDLQEEFAERAHRDGVRGARSWYWSQTLRSLPPLLSYSRAPATVGTQWKIAAVSLGVLLSMLAGKDMLDRLVDAARPALAVPEWLYFALNWLVAVACGTLLARLLRAHPVRSAFVASAALVAAFALPILFSLSPRLSAAALLLLAGAIPAMCAGAAASRLLRS